MVNYKECFAHSLRTPRIKLEPTSQRLPFPRGKSRSVVVHKFPARGLIREARARRFVWKSLGFGVKGLRMRIWYYIVRCLSQNIVSSASRSDAPISLYLPQAADKSWLSYLIFNLFCKQAGSFKCDWGAASFTCDRRRSQGTSTVYSWIVWIVQTTSIDIKCMFVTSAVIACWSFLASVHEFRCGQT